MGRLKRMPSVGGSLRLVMLASILVTVAGAAVFLYLRLHEVIIAGFDSQLVAASATVSAALRGRPVRECLARANGSDTAMRAFPEWRLLRRVQEDAGLTYAYTFLLAGDTGITYLVDGSPDGDACAVGATEKLPKENVEGLLRAWRVGYPFVSRVLRYEQWGLLKVSATPILDSSGAPVAMAGADLEVSVIRRRVRSGVFVAIGLSLVVVLLSALLAQYTLRRLLGAVRDTTRALVAIAAGDTQALLPLQRGYPAEVERMNATANAWITARRRELGRREGRGPADWPGQVTWESHAPSRASCLAMGEYLVAWCRAEQRGVSTTPLFFFGTQRGAVATIREYLRPSGPGAGFEWTHPSGLEPFLEGLWWYHVPSGRAGGMGRPAGEWVWMPGVTGEKSEGWLVTVRQAEERTP